MTVAVDFVVTLLGVVLLLSLSIDVTLTLFSPFGHHGGPVHRRQNRALWSAFRTLGRLVGGHLRPRVLSLAGPVGVLATVLLWSLWLIGGFALIYLPHLDAVRRLTPVSSPRWLDALYYSGYVASTLGLGDVVPASGSMRMLTIAEAVGGFTLFAMSTTYALTVIREAQLAVTLSAAIAAFRSVATERTAGGHGTGSESASDLLALAGRQAEGWSSDLLRITDAHVQYPLLHYFRPEKEERSLVRQLDWIVAALDPPSHFFATASGRLLAESLDAYLRRVNSGCVPERFAPLPAVGGSRQQLLGRLQRHLAYRPAPSTTEVVTP